MRICQECFRNFKGHGTKFCNQACRIKKWKRLNRDKIRRALAKYRANNLEKCRMRIRENQRLLNNKNRFGGLRDKALEKDNYTCSYCGKMKQKGQRLVVHHKDHNKKNNTLENFITLCQSCHAQLHYKEDCRTQINGGFAPISYNLKCYVHHKTGTKHS